MEVKLVDHLGDDLRVVNAARVSFDKESEWEFILSEYESPISKDIDGKSLKFKTAKAELSEKDQKLIKYLAAHNHWTPFSHVMITMREKVPIFVARQRFKHMVGFTYNEVSRRYVDDAPEFFVPDAWRKKAENKKQGSSDEIVTDLRYQGFNLQTIHDAYEKLILHAEILYNDMLEANVAPEQARMVLPQSMFTEYYCTGSLSAWARAYKLRIDPHAQKEIQDLAKMWGDVISGIPEMEYSWKALVT